MKKHLPRALSSILLSVALLPCLACGRRARSVASATAAPTQTPGAAPTASPEPGETAYFITSTAGEALAKEIVGAYREKMAEYGDWNAELDIEARSDPAYKKYMKLFDDPRGFLLFAGGYMQENGLDIRQLAASTSYIYECLLNTTTYSFDCFNLSHDYKRFVGELADLYSFVEEYPAIYRAYSERMKTEETRDMDALLNSEIDFTPFLEQLKFFVEDREATDWLSKVTWDEASLSAFYGGKTYGAKRAEKNTILLAYVPSPDVAKWVQSACPDAVFTRDPDAASVILYATLTYRDYRYQSSSGSEKLAKVGTYVLTASDAVTGEDLGEFRISRDTPDSLANTDASTAYIAPHDLDANPEFVAFIQRILR